MIRLAKHLIIFDDSKWVYNIVPFDFGMIKKICKFRNYFEIIISMMGGGFSMLLQGI